MLKFVESDELAIHSLLNKIKAKFNHTIPILDLVTPGIQTIIVTHYELVLRYAPDSIKTNGNNLALQFLEGVQFMHQHNVAHLDLKPDNIVLRTTTHSQRLLLIDFSVSVQVAGQESWIEGYRGTEDWAAPEVEESTYQPIRADLWSAGQMLQYFADRQHPDTNFTFKPLAKKLLNHNPMDRPLLSRSCLSYEGNHRNQMLKRKRGVDAPEKEQVRHPYVPSRVIPQDINCATSLTEL